MSYNGSALRARLKMKQESPKGDSLSHALQDHIQSFIASLTKGAERRGFDALTLGSVEFLSASHETQIVRFAFTVLPTLCNRAGNLHGGAATAIFDTLTTSALLTSATPGNGDMFGVTRTLTVTFLRPLPRGTRVMVDCSVVAVGKKMVNLRGTMTTGDGKLCATCVHDKALLDKPKL